MGLQEEQQRILEERSGYFARGPNTALRLWDKLSFVFFLCGFVALAGTFWGYCSLLDATCLFVISYVIAPSDGDRYELQIKGLCEDVAHIRAKIYSDDK